MKVIRCNGLSIRWCIVAVAALLACARAGFSQPMRDRIMKIDVVELIGKGQEIEGKAEFAATHDKFTYWFANEPNMMTFLMNEEKYSIQLNGACGRMGPLSGDGTPRLFAVHEGKLYIFASEQCKARFESDPTSFIDSDDPAPQPSEEERKAGRALLGRAVDAFACTAGIDNLTTLRQVAARDEESGGKTYHVTCNMTLQFPDNVFREDCWNDSCWAYVVTGDNGTAISKDGREPMSAQQRTALVRTAGRHPIALLRHRNDKDLIISSTGATRTIDVQGEGEVALDIVTVHRAGATTTLGIDSAGRVRLMAYRGRVGVSSIGDVECIYSDFQGVEGVRLPRRMDVKHNGKAVPEESLTFTEQVINDPKDAARFVPPSSQDTRKDK